MKLAYRLVNLNKKENRKIHALGWSVTIVYDMSVDVSQLSIMYTSQICLIGMNLKALAILYNSSKVGLKFFKAT